MTKRMKSVAVCVLAVSLLVSTGCQTAGRTAGAGAALGAIAGAVIGHQSGHAAEGAAIGAVAGGATGYAVHKIRARKKQNRQTTERRYTEAGAYKPSQGQMINIERGVLNPGTVRPGGSVKASMEYAVLGSGQGGMAVREIRTLKKGQQQLALLSSDEFTRDDGTWVSDMEFTVPSNAAPGEYALEQKVEGQGVNVRNITAFTVTN